MEVNIITHNHQSEVSNFAFLLHAVIASIDFVTSVPSADNSSRLSFNIDDREKREAVSLADHPRNEDVDIIG